MTAWKTIESPRRALGTVARRASLMLLLATLALAVGCGKKTPDERLQEANRLLQERQTARGVIELKKLVRDLPDTPEAAQANLLLAQYYTQQGQAREALAAIDEVVSKHGPDTELGVMALAGSVAIRAQIGDYEDGLKFLDDALAKAGDDAQLRETLLRDRALFLRDWGIRGQDDDRLQESLAALRKLMLEGESELRHSAREELAQYHRAMGQYDESSRVYEEFLEANPDTPLASQLRMAIAINARQAGRDVEARKLFETEATAMLEAAEAELDKETRSRMLLDLAQYRAAMKDLDQAEELMKRVMRENQGTILAIQTQNNIALMYGNAGEFDKAIAIWERMIQDNPNSNISASAEGYIEQTRAAMAAIASREDGETTGTLKLPRGVRSADGETTGTEQNAPEAAEEGANAPTEP